MNGYWKIGIALLAVSASALAAENVSPGPAYSDQVAAAWELKGLRLGLAPDAVKAQVTGLQCRALSKGVDECKADGITFAGGSGHLVLRFLDDSLISITVDEISRTQTTSAGLGLEEKYGPASRDFVERRDISATRVNIVGARRMVWRSESCALLVLPFESRNYDTGDYFSAVRLVDLKRHDYEWLPRSEGHQVKPANDI